MLILRKKTKSIIICLKNLLKGITNCSINSQHAPTFWNINLANLLHSVGHCRSFLHLSGFYHAQTAFIHSQFSSNLETIQLSDCSSQSSINDNLHRLLYNFKTGQRMRMMDSYFSNIKCHLTFLRKRLFLTYSKSGKKDQ